VSSALQYCGIIQEVAVSKTVPKNCQFTNLHTFFLCNEFNRLEDTYTSSHFYVWLTFDNLR